MRKRPRMERMLLGLALVLGLMGCQSQKPPVQETIIPSLEPHVPRLQLKLGWSGAVYEVPKPVIVPAEMIQNDYAAWERNGCNSTWPVRLSDGRMAVMVAARVRTTEGGPLKFYVPEIAVYRSDGTLQLKQHGPNNLDESGQPNTPTFWETYETDGKTASAYVGCFGVGKTAFVQTVVFYEGGKMAREYEADDQGVVCHEWKINAKGERLGTIH